MKKLYHDLVAALWSKHEETPLSANETALYLFLLEIGNKSGCSMPIRLHNSEVCPMLMEKSALEKARKKLQDKGLITYTTSRSPRHLPTYTIIGCETGESTKKSPSKDERIMVEFLARMWQAFDERALNASEVALLAYILHEAERNQWKMPVRIKDYMPLTLLLKQSNLNDARNEVASRSLIAFEASDGKRDVPKYTLVGMDSIAASSKTASSKDTSRPKPKPSKKPDEPAAEARSEVNAEVNLKADTLVATGMLQKKELNVYEAQDRGVVEVKSYPMPKQMPSIKDAADKDVSESNSYVSANLPFNNTNKPMDMRRDSFGMTGNGRNNEARDEYDFWD